MQFAEVIHLASVVKYFFIQFLYMFDSRFQRSLERYAHCGEGCCSIFRCVPCCEVLSLFYILFKFILNVLISLDLL